MEVNRRSLIRIITGGAAAAAVSEAEASPSTLSTDRVEMPVQRGIVVLEFDPSKEYMVFIDPNMVDLRALQMWAESTDLSQHEWKTKVDIIPALRRPD